MYPSKPAEIIVVATLDKDGRPCPSYEYVPLIFDPAVSARGSLSEGDSLGLSHAVISGDAHGNDLSLMQIWAYNGIIALDKSEDWDVLSALAQSTILDQMNALDQLILEISASIRNCKKKYKDVSNQLAWPENASKPAVLDKIQKEKQSVRDEYHYLSALLELQNTLLESLCDEAIKEKNAFIDIVDRMLVLDIKTLVGDLGDSIGDRHNFDFKRLYLNKKFREKNGQFFALESNHGLEVHLAYLLQRWNVDDQLFLLGGDSDVVVPEARSLTNLRVAIAHGIVTQEEVNDLMENWLETLHLLTYSYAEGSEHQKPRMTIYSHARVGLGEIFDRAIEYGISYKDETIAELMEVMDAIDAAFRKSLIKKIGELAYFQGEMTRLKESYFEKYLKAGAEKALAGRVDLKKYLWRYLSVEFQEMLDEGEALSPKMLLSILEKSQNLVPIIKIIEKEIALPGLINKSEKSIDSTPDQTSILQITNTFLYKILAEINQVRSGADLDIYEDMLSTVLHVFWNRRPDNINRVKEYKDYELYFSHGHQKTLPLSPDVPVVVPDNICELDNIYGKPFRPCSVKYGMNLKAENLKVVSVSENDPRFFVAYSFCSDQGSYGTILSLEKVPKHYFTGLIPLNKNNRDFCSEEEAQNLLNPQIQAQIFAEILKNTEIRKRIQEEMNQHTRAVIMHNTYPVDLSYLAVSYERFPIGLVQRPVVQLEQDSKKHEKATTVVCPNIKETESELPLLKGHCVKNTGNYRENRQTFFIESSESSEKSTAGCQLPALGQKASENHGKAVLPPLVFNGKK